MPSDNTEETPYLYTETQDIKMVADYTNLSFEAALELDCYTYKLLLKDAFIMRMSQSVEGREYLENCWILSQVNPDRHKLRKMKQE